MLQKLMNANKMANESNKGTNGKGSGQASKGGKSRYSFLYTSECNTIGAASKKAQKPVQNQAPTTTAEPPNPALQNFGQQNLSMDPNDVTKKFMSDIEALNTQSNFLNWFEDLQI